MQYVVAEKENLPDVYRLVCELEHAELDRAAFEKVYEGNLANPDIYYLLAMDDQVVAGFASLHIQCLLHHIGRVGEVQELIVSKHYQGQGIGRELFDKLKETAAANGCVLLEVCCNQSRKESHKFYLKQNMKNSHYKFTSDL